MTDTPADEVALTGLDLTVVRGLVASRGWLGKDAAVALVDEIERLTATLAAAWEQGWDACDSASSNCEADPGSGPCGSCPTCRVQNPYDPEGDRWSHQAVSEAPVTEESFCGHLNCPGGTVCCCPATEEEAAEAPLPWARSTWAQCRARREPRPNHTSGRCDLRAGHDGDHALDRGMDTPRWSTDWTSEVSR